MAEHRGDVGRQAQFLAEEVDPIAQQVMDTADPWKAYEAANAAPGALVDALDWMPHGGRIYVAWAELTDLYDAGKVPIAEAHAALRQAASDWLDRPGPTAEAFIDGWLRSWASCEVRTSRWLRRRPSRTSTRCWPATPGLTRG